MLVEDTIVKLNISFRSLLTPVMNHVPDHFKHDEAESRRSSTPVAVRNLSDLTKWATETVDVCTDCFVLLKQIREKNRQRHINPPLVPSKSSSFNRSYYSSSRSTSNYNLSSSSSTSSIAPLLAPKQQQQSLLMVKSNSIQSNLKQTRTIHELSGNNDSQQTLITISETDGKQRVSLSRRHLFLELQPAYDEKLNNIQTN